MMEQRGLRREERIGLAVALVLHLALVGALFVQPETRKPVPEPQRMTVNLATDVGLQATAPDPVSESRASQAPELGADSTPAPLVEQPPEPAIERPAPPEVERPQPKPTAKPTARPTAKPTARPTPKPSARPSAKPSPRPSAKPSAKPSPKPSAKPTAKPTQSTKPTGSRLGDNFLDGAGNSTQTEETRVPASQIGASAKASLFQAVGRQLRPHWQPPSGPDVDKIVTKVRFRLNANGSLNGRPTLVGQRGVNDTNRAQAGRHGEQAIRAVQLAAPFDLPEEYYEAWKTVTVDFDWKLAQ